MKAVSVADAKESSPRAAAAKTSSKEQAWSKEEGMCLRVPNSCVLYHVYVSGSVAVGRVSYASLCPTLSPSLSLSLALCVCVRLR